MLNQKKCMKNELITILLKEIKNRKKLKTISKVYIHKRRFSQTPF